MFIWFVYSLKHNNFFSIVDVINSYDYVILERLIQIGLVLKMCENVESSPSEIEDGTLKAIKELVRLPARSRERYEITFNKYQDWCTRMGINEEELTNEKVLISYFNYLISKDNKPPTLWSNYSMIRSMIAVNKNVDVSKYSNLLSLLKRKSVGYKPRKSKTFERHDVRKFLSEANDDEFLLTKVAFIIGLAGACKKKELTDLTTDNVKDKGDYFHFFLRSARVKVSRDFLVTAGNIKGVNLVDLIRKYVNLRPWVEHNRFFVQYSNGVCNKHPVGINTLGGLSRKIAKYLKLRNPDQYTGHCLRRSCTLLLAGAGANISTIKRHGGWKSSLEAEGYFFSSVENKRRIATKILGNSETNQGTTSSWGDEVEMVHVRLNPEATYHASKEMVMLVEPIEYTIGKNTAKFSPLTGEMSSRRVIDQEECTESFMKLETCSTSDLDSTSDYMETEEANEDCEAFNQAEPTIAIPSENLELFHLDKMNKPVDEARNSDRSTNVSVSGDKILQVKSLSALNSVTESDIAFSPLLLSSQHENKTFSNLLRVQGTHTNIELVHVPEVIKDQITEMNSQNHKTPSSLHSSQNKTTHDENSTNAEQVSVESVAEKVMEKLLSSTTNSEVLHAVFSSLLTNQNKKQTAPTVSKSVRPTDLTTNEMQDVGSKVLRMFVIDKQMEELMQEKKEIYKELFSIGEISSSLFNSWAQEKIHTQNNRKTLFN